MNKQRSIILELDDAKQELIQCVNSIMGNHGLPCYLIEPMFAELYAEIQATAKRELAQAREQEARIMQAQTQAVDNGAE